MGVHVSLVCTQGTAGNTDLHRPDGETILRALPRRLPDAQSIRAAGKHMSDRTKVETGRAIAALKQSVKIMAIVRYMNTEGARCQGNDRKSCDSGKGKGEAGGDDESSDSEDEDEVADGSKVPGESVGGGRAASGAAKSGLKYAAKVQGDGDRFWVMTVHFYQHLETAAARLECARTSDKGYAYWTSMMSLVLELCAQQAFANSSKLAWPIALKQVLVVRHTSCSARYPLAIGDVTQEQGVWNMSLQQWRKR